MHDTQKELEDILENDPLGLLGEPTLEQENARLNQRNLTSNSCLSLLIEIANTYAESLGVDTLRLEETYSLNSPTVCVLVDEGSPLVEDDTRAIAMLMGAIKQAKASQANKG